jgi:hypothetical protein
MDRRIFLNTMGQMIVGGIILNPFQKIFANNVNIALPSWQSLIETARWCPTVHNLQPHRIKIISNNTAELYYDPKCLLPIGDPKAIFATIALGIFIEHLNITAKQNNCEILIEGNLTPIDINAVSYKKFATLKLSTSKCTEIITKNDIINRRTSRLHYDGIAIDKNEIDILKNEVLSHKHNLNSSNNSVLINKIIDHNKNTLFEDLSSAENCKELDRLFRYSHHEAKEKKDGLWARCMGFPGALVKSIFKHPGHWQNGILKNKLGAFYKKSFLGTATICWVNGPFASTNDWAHAGKMMARLWLMATKHNMYIQPFGSLITNQNAYKHLCETLECTNPDLPLWMIFRMGHSKTPTKSFRHTTEDLLIN